jgi:hypothetical protein
MTRKSNVLIVILAFCAWTPKAIHAQKAVIDVASIAQAAMELKQLKDYIDDFKKYMDGFNDSVNNITGKDLGIPELDAILNGDNSYINSTIMNPQASLCNFIYPVKDGNGTVANAACNSQGNIGGVQLPGALQSVIDSTKQASQVYSKMRKAIDDMWNELNYANLNMAQYGKKKQDYANEVFKRSQDSYVYIAAQLGTVDQLYKDIQSDVDKIPNVSTNLQHSLELVNRQLARITTENQTLISMMATNIIDRQSKEPVKLKDMKEHDAMVKTYMEKLQQALDKDAKELGMDKGMVRLGIPDYDKK